ncbi:unnamed protein product [Moneuplotes crassus]|uniref:Uncharacterized protein n=1 Tax=Euplotes crassus TaxID=5936 RepID=A0AAD2D7Y6_EUPCR|nr:unnamed protein product [Moneuplotes crassus]
MNIKGSSAGDPASLETFMSEITTKQQKRESLAINIHKLKKIERSMILTQKNSAKLEEQGEILLKHELIVKDAVVNKALDVRLQIFQADLQRTIENRLDEFSCKFSDLISKKVDASFYKETLDSKAAKTELNKTNEQVMEFNEKMELLNQYLEKLRRDEEEKRNPVQNEIDRLDNDKADQLEFMELQQKVIDLKEIVDSFDEDDEDEFDDEDSVEEDVLSLNQSGNNLNANSNSASDKDEQKVEENAEEQQPEEENKDQTINEVASVEKRKEVLHDMPDMSQIKSIIEENPLTMPLKTVVKTNSVSPADSPQYLQKINLSNIDTQKEVHLQDDDFKSPIIKPVKIDMTQKSKRDTTPDPATPAVHLKSTEKEESVSKETPRIEAAPSVMNSTAAAKNESGFNFNNTKESFNKSSFTKTSKVQRKETESTVKSRSKLSRMNSKMSMVSSRRKGPGAGLKTKIDELNKKVQISNLNMEKALEDFKTMKNQEAQRHERFQEMDDLVTYLQKNYDQWLDEHQEIIIRHQELDEQYNKGLVDISDKYSKISKIYKETKQMVEANRKAFKDGFERIIRCEVNQQEDHRRIQVLQNKIKEDMLSKALPNESLEKLQENYAGNVDEKFEVLYDRIHQMATDQADFNLKMKKSLDRLGAPIQKQMETMIKENELMHIELERSQNHNRELLTSCGFFRNNDNLKISNDSQFSDFKRKKSMLKRQGMNALGNTTLNLTSLSFGKSKPDYDTSDHKNQVSFQFDSYIPMAKRSKRASPITFSANRSKIKLFKPSKSTDRKSFDSNGYSHPSKIKLYTD